jgi:protein arginine N-methyltransferase 1
MYSTSGYGWMIADGPRMRAYEAALKRVIRPDSIVLDLGSGSGIMAFLACRIGASRVIAVEPDNVVQLARQIAAANGWGTRIEFLQGLSTSMEPPQRCDVVVSDIGGALPLFMRHIPTILDARERWLVEGGIQIPQKDSLFAAVIESPSVWDRHFTGWTSDVGVDFSPALLVRSGCLGKAMLEGPETLLAEPALWTSIDYRTVTLPNYDAVVSWRAYREGTGHGIALWFDRELTDGVTFSNSPGTATLSYGQMYLPWPSPVRLQRGDWVEARIQAHLVGENYVWAWDTTVRSAAADGLLRTFHQSSLQGSTWTSEWLASHRIDARPTLGPRGRAALEVLQAMERGTAVGEISEALMKGFPEEFHELPQSLSFVSGLQGTYGATL